MQVNRDFTIEPFKPRNHEPRSDKGSTITTPRTRENRRDPFFLRFFLDRIVDRSRRILDKLVLIKKKRRVVVCSIAQSCMDLQVFYRRYGLDISSSIAGFAASSGVIPSLL
jgi:hypothetical protein